MLDGRSVGTERLDKTRDLFFPIGAAEESRRPTRIGDFTGRAPQHAADAHSHCARKISCGSWGPRRRSRPTTSAMSGRPYFVGKLAACDSRGRRNALGTREMS